MGFIAALNNAEGKDIIMKLLLLTVFATVALAEEATEMAAEEAKPVVPVLAYNQLHWSGVTADGRGFSSQTWGARPAFQIVHPEFTIPAHPWYRIGKRSADAEPEAKPGLGYYGLPHYGYGYHPYALPLVHVTPDLTLKGDGVAAHPNGATATTQRSAQGAPAGLALLGRKRRSAEPGYAYGYVPHYPLVYHAVAPVVAPIAGEGVAAHPNLGTSKVSPTTWGFPSAE